eukprot:5173816-Lingulodinium_polyedra.AAC.1
MLCRPIYRRAFLRDGVQRGFARGGRGQGGPGRGGGGGRAAFLQAERLRPRGLIRAGARASIPDGGGGLCRPRR